MSDVINMDDLIFSQNYHQSFDMNKTGRNNNVLVFATTGAGKTVSVVYPQLLHSYHNSLIFTFTKQKYITKFVKLLNSRGYDIEFIDLTCAKKSNVGFDPLAYIHNVQDIRNLANLIVDVAKKDSVSTDHYWDDAACELLCAEIALAFTLFDMMQEDVYIEGMQHFDIQKNKPPSFNDVLAIHQFLRFSEIRGSGFTVSTLDEIFNSVETWADKNGHDSQAVIWFKSVRGLASKTVSCIYSNLTVILNNIFTPSIKEVIAFSFLNKPKSLNISKLGLKKTVLLIYTSPIERANDFFISILYTTLFKELAKTAELYDGSLPVPVHIICDDFAVGSKIPDFHRYASIMREFNISFCILLQSLSQLFGMYGENNGKTIVNNCDTLIYMGGMDTLTCQDISLRTNRPLDEIMYMPLGDVWIMQRGGAGPIRDIRYQTFEDELWHNLFFDD